MTSISLAVMAVTAATPAQTSLTHWSLEAMAAQARTVFRGIVMDVSKLELEGKPGDPPRVRISLTVRVDERFKGSPDRWMTLDRETLASDTRYDLWKKAETPMLWFAFSQDDPRPFPGSSIGPGLDLPAGRSWTAIHLTEPEKAELAIDKDAARGSFSIEAKALSVGKDKIEATSKYEKKNPETVKVTRISIPPVLAKSLGYEGIAIHHIVLPITADLEATATKMLNEPESFLPKDATAGDLVWIRTTGAKALASFNSEKNVALMKSLLTDASKGPTDNTDSPVKTFYWLRLAAFNALTDWGVKVEKPVLND